MALYIYQAGMHPLGQFDVLDGYLTSIMGGEVGTLYEAPRTNTADEMAAADARDGYTNLTDVTRAAVANSITGSTQRPLWLLDDGTTGYGTLFGQVIGTPVGLRTTGTNLGPHTAAGSGKVTCWNKPGLYAVSVDAVGAGVELSGSLVPGAALYPDADGKLTTATTINVEVARFVEFETSPFLVNTPASLVGAAEVAVRAVFDYNVAG